MTLTMATEKRTRYRLFLIRLAWCSLALLIVGLVFACVQEEGTNPSPISVVVRCDHCAELPSVPETRQDFPIIPSWPSGYLLYLRILCIVFTLIYFAVAGVLIWHKTDDRMAVFAAFYLVLLAPAFCKELPESSFLWHQLVERIWYIGLICLFIFFCVFPTGRLQPWWGGCLAAASTVYWGTYALFLETPLNPFTDSFLGQLIKYLLLISFVILQIYRYRRISQPPQQHQTKWVVFGMCSALLFTVVQQQYSDLIDLHIFPPLLNSILSQTVIFVTLLLIPLSIGIAILRSRLWNIDLIIHRTLVYGVLSACVVGLYVLVVGGLGTLLQGQGNVLVSLLAIGLIAALVHPLRELLQQGVSHLVYGARHDPYQVLSRLSQRLETTLAPQAALSMIVETVAQAFKLPYVAIILKQGAHFLPGAIYGHMEEKDTFLHIALNYQGELLGELILSSDPSGKSFSRTDRRLLENLARHAGVAIHTVRLNADIQRSREQLVMMREEERRRLRRDLHDGLGPQLASQMLLLTTVRKLIRKKPEVAESVLSEAMIHMQDAIRDIRRLVYGLRPPALDDLGLLATLQEDMQRYDTSDITFTLVAPEQLPLLPAAVEVACYRIAQEALTNVIKHANACHCILRLNIDDVLELEVTDDGRGFPIGYKNGIGLTSMRERAQELGGSWSIDTRPEGGTRVYARLPLLDRES